MYGLGLSPLPLRRSKSAGTLPQRRPEAAQHQFKGAYWTDYRSKARFYPVDCPASRPILFGQRCWQFQTVRRLMMPAQIENLTGPKICWGGVWAGFFVGLGSEVVLASIGVGAGLHAVARSGAPNLPAGVMVWTAIAWIVSAFLAGYVAVWMSGRYAYWEGMFHSFVTWGVLISALAYLPTYGDLAFLGRETATMSPAETASWWMFVSGILSLTFALMGGVFGARAARRTQVKEHYPAAA